MRWISLTLLCVCMFQGTPRAASYKAKSCSYSNLDSNVSDDGPCTMQEAKINGNFAYIMIFKDGTRASIEYLRAQGGTHLWNINGRPAMGFEINREHLIGGSIDLKQSIEWEDR